MNKTSEDYFQRMENEKREGKSLCGCYSMYTEIKKFFDSDVDFLIFFKEAFSSHVDNYFFCEHICSYLDNIKKIYRELKDINQTVSLKEIHDLSFELSFFIDLNFKVNFSAVEIVALDIDEEYIFSINYDLKKFKNTVDIVEKETKLCRKTILNFETQPPVDLFLKIDLLLNQEFFDSIVSEHVIRENALDFATYEKYRDLIIINDC